MNSTVPSSPRLENTKAKKRKNRSRDTFGDKLHKHKNSDIIRIMFQNLNGLGTSEETCKRELIKEFLTDYNIDIYAMAEINTNWKIVSKKQSFLALAKTWFSHTKVVTANNLITSTKNPISKVE